jgi:hypothetical protein
MKTMRLIECGMAMVVLLLSVENSGAESKRPDLTGRVTREDGQPARDATVFVYTAGPKVGTAVVCPSCYPDCNKKAKTSPRGDFTISSLDPRLKFRLLVVAPDCEPRFAEKIDPAEGEVSVVLTPIKAEKLKALSMIGGMIMDEKGKPVPGALVSPEGIARGQSTQWGGTDRFVDPLAISDEQGRFRLYCSNTVEKVHAVVEGRGVAKRWVELKPGRDHLIRMQDGATVSGSVWREGKPVKEVVVSLVTRDRVCGRFLRYEELATDKDGHFSLPNVPPNNELVFYARMDSVPQGAQLPIKVFTSGATGSKLDFGKVELRPGHRLAGRVVLSDGKSVPEDTRIMLGREDAWDHQEAVLDAEGRFEFFNVPTESMGLSVRVKGYKYSKRNASLDWLNGGIMGRVESDIPDLTLLMEPGEWKYNGDEGDPPNGETQPRERPLRGAKPQ